MTGACPLLCSNHDGVHGLVHACGPTQLSTCKSTSAGPSSTQTTTTFPASFRCWHSRRSRRYIVRTVYAKVRQAIAKVGSAIQAVRACSAATGTRAEPGALTSLSSANSGACSTSLRRLSCCSLRPPLACCSLRSPLACCSLRSPYSKRCRRPLVQDETCNKCRNIIEKRSSSLTGNGSSYKRDANIEMCTNERRRKVCKCSDLHV